jgi:cytochrome c peroxidase
MTNTATVDVGTGGSFQVPSLRGLLWRPPYMHDGCASTIADRFGACGGTKHGQVSTLSAGQKADLVTYLETL